MQTSDLVIAPFSSTYDRQVAADFLETQMYVEDTVILYKKPDADEYMITLFYSVSWLCMSVITMFWYVSWLYMHICDTVFYYACWLCMCL